MSSTTPQSHETDPRWTAVDHYTTSQLDSHTTPLNHTLTHALQNQTSHGLPAINVSPAQGKFLMLQCRMLGVRHALETGTLGGYSTIWLAHASPDIKITTIEVDERHAAVARENLKVAGVEGRVEVLLGRGVDVLARLRGEVERGERERFGFVFVDADKENSWAYFDACVPMCMPRACVVVDNVVRKGQLADEEAAKADSRVEGSRRVVEMVGRDQKVDAVVMQTVGEKSYDGFLMAVVKE